MNIHEMERFEDQQWAEFMVRYENLEGYDRAIVGRMMDSVVSSWLQSEFEKMMKCQ